LNASEYIASGILEIYVLGRLSAEEVAEVEAMASQHPEVQEEIHRIEAAYEAIAQQSSVAPRASLRGEILNNIAPESKSEPQESIEQPLAKRRRILPYQLGIAASVALAVLSSGAALYFYNQWQGVEEELSEVVAQNQEIATQYETAAQRADRLSNDLSIATSPDFQLITLEGTEVSPSSLSQVYWNPTESQLYFNPGSLPTPPPDRQYQLWAIVDGKPVSAGLVDTADQKLLAMSVGISEAAAFAITLEPRGGSEAPTLDQMYVQGKVIKS